MQVAALPPRLSHACISSRLPVDVQMEAEKAFVEWAMSEGRIVVHPTTCYGVRECSGNSTFDQSCHWGTEGRYVCLRCVLLGIIRSRLLPSFCLVQLHALQRAQEGAVRLLTHCSISMAMPNSHGAESLSAQPPYLPACCRGSPRRWMDLTDTLAPGRFQEYLGQTSDSAGSRKA
jgi:hypothetical protein